MAWGQVFVDGHPPRPLTGRQMCEAVVDAGLWAGTPEELWNCSPGGELYFVFEMYFLSLAVGGHSVEMEVADGVRKAIFGGLRS